MSELLALSIDGKLKNQLQLSTKILPDEAWEALLKPFGPAAKNIKLVDVVRKGEQGFGFDVRFGPLKKTLWARDVIELCDALNSFFLTLETPSLWVVLGEHEDFWHLVMLPQDEIEDLLEKKSSVANSEGLSSLLFDEDESN